MNKSQICEFVQVYLLDWPVLSVLLVPLLFSLLFPVYWLIICPQIWEENPDLFRPRTWLIAYWAFAFIVWILFLAICFLKSKDNNNKIKQCGEDHKTGLKTEDIWHEDRYLPSPEYMISPVQPDSASGIVEEKSVEYDESWDFDYEDEKRMRKYSEPCDFYHHRSSDDENESGASGLKSNSRGRFLSVGSSRYNQQQQQGPGSNSSSNNHHHHRRPLSHYGTTSSVSSSSSGSICSNYGGAVPRRYPPSTGSRRRASPPFVNRHHLRPLRSPSQSPRPHLPGCPSALRSSSARHVSPPTQAEKYNLISQPASSKSPTCSSSSASITDDELRSLRDVCEGKIERRDSLVRDAKFDSLLSSLQSLASDLEKDFHSSDNPEEQKNDQSNDN